MDNFDLRKYLVENKITTNSRMTGNENTYRINLPIIDELLKDSVVLKSHTKPKGGLSIPEIESFINKNRNKGKFLWEYSEYDEEAGLQELSPEVALETAKSIETFSEVPKGVVSGFESSLHFVKNPIDLEKLASVTEYPAVSKMMNEYSKNKVTTNSKIVNEAEVKDVKTVIARHKAGLLSALKARRANPEDLDAHNEVKKYLETIASELGLDKNIPFMEDEMYSGRVKPLEALKHVEETFTDWVEDSEMMNENEGSVRDQISNWYHKTNFYIDEKSPEEAEDGINAHYDEYMAVKDQYDNIQDYFEDVERAGDWY